MKLKLNILKKKEGLRKNYATLPSLCENYN